MSLLDKLALNKDEYQLYKSGILQCSSGSAHVKVLPKHDISEEGPIDPPRQFRREWAGKREEKKTLILMAPFVQTFSVKATYDLDKMYYYSLLDSYAITFCYFTGEEPNFNEYCYHYYLI